MPKNNDSSQGDGGNPPPPAAAAAAAAGTGTGAGAGAGAGAGGVTAPPQDFQRSRNGNKVYKSGPLFLSSRGIGWTSWKKRWFILTHTSLVFFRSDPNVVSQKGNEVNLTLGGIDLNSSGSVVVKADKKLLTVLFPDGRDGRAFTLKAETSEDLFEWKAALEEALANAPSAGVGMGKNGILKNDKGDVVADGSQEQSKDRQPAKSFVVGAPILLALEDIDGTPSFLEKALRFIEEYGVKVEGILRQAADVDDVERRIREYEQGKSEFSPEEDAHIIGDCIKYVLRELPSSPVPASCCNALLEAFRTDRSTRVSNMRGAICETFPEPNRRLLQRILMMMQTVASHKTVNRMSVSAVAACMAPLLLRPLLAGDCELDNDFDMGGDGSVQLLQAAAAANHAQAIVITLLEEYENIFGEGSMSTDLYSDSEVSGSESEELSDDDETYEEDEEDGEYTSEGSNGEEDYEEGSNVTCSETGDDGDSDEHDEKGSDALSTNSISHATSDDLEDSQKLSPSSQRSSSQHDKAEVNVNTPNEYSNHSTADGDEPGEQLDDDSVEPSPTHGSARSFKKSRTRSNGPSRSSRRSTVWGRTGAKKNLSVESIDVVSDDESEIQKLELTKADLEHKIAKEARGNARLQQDMLRRKNALKERRLALEQDVARLQEELQKEKELKAALQAGVKNSQVALPLPASISEKTKADLEEIVQAEADIASLKQKADDLGAQLNQQREQNSVFGRDPSNQPAQASNQGKMKDKEKDVEALTTSRGEKARSKDSHSSKAHDDKDAKQQAHANKHLPANQQSDALRNLRSAGAQATSASPEPGMGKSSSTNSKRSSSRGEGANTTSALSKLTNRLNFLKERRNQIANELQSIDKGKHSAGQPTPKGGKRSELPVPVTSTDKPHESEGQSSEKGKGLDNSHPSTDRAVTAEGSSHQNVDASKKPDVQSTDKGRKSDGQSASNLEKGKSESVQNAEKGRSSGAATTRTSSR